MSEVPSDPSIGKPTRPRVERALKPVREFLDTESAGAIALVAAAVVALVWANTPMAEMYERVWRTELAIGLGDWGLALDLRHWVNDGLMTLFFLVVSLEIKRELVHGDLSGIRKAALPVVAAIGGMVVPALVYLLFNSGGPEADGWGIPMATDIAFAVGIVTLAAPRISQAAKIFLLSVAIVDDIGAILVIAIFYSSSLQWLPLGLALAGALLMYALRHVGLRASAVYFVLGTLVWLATLESGVHATIAGVVIGFLTPVRPALEDEWDRLKTGAQRLLQQPTPQKARAAKQRAREVVAPGEWLEHLLHPWTSFLIVPLFAVANAGLPLTLDVVGDAFGSPVAAGIFVGLVVGKPLGICAAAFIAVRLRIGALPEETSARDIAGLGALAGIGFTVSLFISDLAFADEALVSEAKLGILAASIAAGLTGALVLHRQRSPRGKIKR